MDRYCRCPDALCLKQGIQCGDCDEDGYALMARRRFKRRADGDLQDIDDQQVFKAKKTKTGYRLLPKFGRMVWKGAQGFAAMLLILSCLGAEGEYVLWDSEENKEMDVDGWVKKHHIGHKSIIAVWHRRCKETVTSTSISNLQQGKCIGCKCHSNQANHWRHRRAELVQWGKEREFEVMTTEKNWVKECNGAFYCPTLRCLKCKEMVTSTAINKLQQGQCIGCKCHSNQANHWRHRRAELVQWGKEREFEVMTTEKNWVEECNNAFYCPTLRCLKCKETVTSTTISNLQQRHGIGCLCRHKTEGKLNTWLRTRFPNTTITPQYSGPPTLCGGQTRFDFHLRFPDGFEIIIELDGPQHFAITRAFSNEGFDAGCERDLLKEKWAVQQGLCVVRVLQEDVWSDRYDWQGWLLRSIDHARSGEPRAMTPDASEYRSSESAYVRLRN